LSIIGRSLRKPEMPQRVVGCSEEQIFPSSTPVQFASAIGRICMVAQHVTRYLETAEELSQKTRRAIREKVA
jgi:hypothetical protein